MVWLFVFVVGAAVGSFIGVVVEREIQDGLKGRLGLIPSWFVGRSRCDSCGMNIKWYDNIPLVSFFVLGKRCRMCHSPIPGRYFVTELGMGLLFVWFYFLLTSGSLMRMITAFNLSYDLGSVFLNFLPYWLVFFLGCLLMWALVSISVVDLRVGLIPDSVLVVSGFFILLLRLWLWISTGDSLFILSPIAFGLASSFFFAAIIFLTRGRGMGWGDVKLSFWMGLWLGWLVVVAVWLAFLTGALAGIILLLGRKKRWGQTIAFGPFLAWGTLVAAFAGGWLVERILLLGFH